MHKRNLKFLIGTFAAVLLIVIIPVLLIMDLLETHDYEIILSSDEITEISIVEIDEKGEMKTLKELSHDSDIIEKLEELKCSRLVPPSYDFVGKGLLIAYSENRYELILDCINSYYKGEQDQWDGNNSNFRTESFAGTEFCELLDEYLTDQ